MFAGFTRSTNPARYDDWLVLLWGLVESPSKAAAQELAAAVESVPEARVDDSHRPDYYAMRALGVLWSAARTLTGDDPLRAALDASGQNLALLGDFDHALGQPASSLKAAEMSAQLEALERLPRGLTCESCRASTVAARLAATVDDLVRAHDWDMSGRSDW